MKLSQAVKPAATVAGSENWATADPPLARWLLIGVAVGFLGLFLVVPLAIVLGEAFGQGLAAYLTAVTDPNAVAAMELTFLTALVAVPFNLAFGIAASWTIATFRFVGRSLLISMTDLPLAVSPVVSGLLFVLLFGAQNWLGPRLDAHGITIVFAVPGIIMVTTFVTFPYVARELIPVMEAIGSEEEEAAVMLGASGWQTLWRVTLPNVKWALLYGVILCNARAMGEFGAVSVVSGHVQGLTNTLPLQVEVLYNDFQFSAAFAVASLLALLAIVTLVVRRLVEWKAETSLSAGGR